MADPLDLLDPQHIVVLKGKRFGTYAGVLSAALKAGLKSLEVTIKQFPGPDNGNCAVCEALAVFVTEGGRDMTFQEIGDCDDRNCGPQIAPHKIRMAATRAKGRALRDALGIGVALREELSEVEADQLSDHLPAPRQTPPVRHEASAAPGPAGSAVAAPAGSHGGAGKRVAAARMAGAEKAADEAPATVLKCGWRKCGKPVEKSWGEASLAAHGHILCIDHLKEAVVWIEAQKQQANEPQITMIEPGAEPSSIPTAAAA